MIFSPPDFRLICVFAAIIATLGLSACFQPSKNLTDKRIKSVSAEEMDATSNKTADSPCLNITNGAETDVYPEVVLLIAVNAEDNSISTCSGSYVASNAILTAHHCLQSNIRIVRGRSFSNLNELLTAYQSGIAPIAIFQHQFFDNAVFSAQDEASRQHDLAVLLMPENSSSEHLNLVTVAPDDNTVATLVGYGRTGMSDDVSSFPIKKRMGKNTVTRHYASSLIAITGALNTTDESGNATDSLGVLGDSGGPLLIDHKVAGVLSIFTFDSHNVPYSFYVDITSQPSQKTLLEAADNGARIIGYFSGSALSPEENREGSEAEATVMPETEKAPSINSDDSQETTDNDGSETGC